MYTLIETCKLNDIDLRAWLADVPARLCELPRALMSCCRGTGRPVDPEGAHRHVLGPTSPSLSTLNQGQAGILKQVIAALAGLPMRALVTLGPALASERFDVPANVRLETFVLHDVVLPHAAALVTQCGIGTITKALRHGVPMIFCLWSGTNPITRPALSPALLAFGSELTSKAFVHR
jgi:hypothetical protein